MLVAMLRTERAEARRGLGHSAEYACPACASPVILHARVGGWVIPHFKHKSKTLCTNGSGESIAHRMAKHVIRDHYISKGYAVELEYPITNRRADVFIPDLAAAFEVEFSPKQALEFIQKCRDYENANIRSLWLIRQDRIAIRDICVGKRIVVSVSRVLDASFERRPRGARVGFFVYRNGEVAVFQGCLESYMLHREYDDYSGCGGFDYPSRRKMWLTIRKVIRSPEVPLHDAIQGI